MADTLRNHHGTRHLNLPEKVAYRYEFGGLEGEDRLPSSTALLPGDDLSKHPGAAAMVGNPFFNKNALTVRRIVAAGKLDEHPKLKAYALQYLEFYARFTGENVLGDSTKRPDEQPKF